MSDQYSQNAWALHQAGIGIPVGVVNKNFNYHSSNLLLYNRFKCKVFFWVFFKHFSYLKYIVNCRTEIISLNWVSLFKKKGERRRYNVSNCFLLLQVMLIFFHVKLFKKHFTRAIFFIPPFVHG